VLLYEKSHDVVGRLHECFNHGRSFIALGLGCAPPLQLPVTAVL
jgi:hypothetical protein